MRRRLVQISCALAACALLAFPGCGDGGGSGSDLADLAPPDAPLYAEFTLRPDDEQASAIEELTSRVAGISAPGAEIVSEIDRLLAENQLDATYADDIEPWLGDRGAFFVRSFEDGSSGLPEFAAMFEVDDATEGQGFLDRIDESAPSAARRKSYDGVDYLYGSEGTGYAVGVVEDSLVIATEASFKVAVDALRGESLAESDDYTERVDALDGEPVLSVFVDPATVIDAALASREISRADAQMVRPLLAETLTSPLAAGLEIDDEAISVEVAARSASGAEDVDGELLGELPAPAVLGVAAPQLGEMLEMRIDQLEKSGLPGASSIREIVRRRVGLDLSSDVAGWLGDVSAFMSGSPSADFTIGAIAETSESEGPRRLIAALRALISREEPQAPIGGAPDGADAGFTVGVPVIGPQAGIGLFGAQLVVSLGTPPEAVLEPDQRLADDHGYEEARDALGSEFAPLLYADLPGLLPFAQAGGATEGRDYSGAGPALEALRYLIVGLDREGDLAVIRFNVASP